MKPIPPSLCLRLPTSGRTLQLANVSADMEKELDVKDAPATFKSIVWKYFGFPKKRQANGDTVVDRKNTAMHRESSDLNRDSNRIVRNLDRYIPSCM